MSGFFLVVVICMFAGDAIASEAGWGNLRYLLARPVGRGRLLTAKLFVAAVFALLVDRAGRALRADRRRDRVRLASVAIPFSACRSRRARSSCTSRSRSCSSPGASPAVIAFAFMLSTMTDSAAGAIFGAVGLYIVSLILNEITSLGSIRYGLPIRYYDAWSDLFIRNEFTDDMWRSILAPDPVRDRLPAGSPGGGSTARTSSPDPRSSQRLRGLAGRRCSP